MRELGTQLLGEGCSGLALAFGHSREPIEDIGGGIDVSLVLVTARRTAAVVAGPAVTKVRDLNLFEWSTVSE